MSQDHGVCRLREALCAYEPVRLGHSQPITNGIYILETRDLVHRSWTKKKRFQKSLLYLQRKLDSQ